MNKNNYYRRVCVDIDDTVSFTINRDWENAKPNLELIKKLNSLYDDGWEVVYCTARGSLSCQTREEASNKYKESIVNWFNTNDVKYTDISFDKILAAYYIDDKSITPEDFISLDIHKLSGLSGAVVEKRNGKVYKKSESCSNEIQWYEIACQFIDVPKVHSLIGDTMCMDYIEKTDEIKSGDVLKIITRIQNIGHHNISFTTYIDRIKSHLSNIPLADSMKSNIVSKFNGKIEEFNNLRSFCHGDMSKDNMIKNGDKVYLIDPIYIPSMYSSWILDVGKFIYSSRYMCDVVDSTQIDILFDIYDEHREMLNLVQLSYAIRLYKYTNDKVNILHRISTWKFDET